MKIFIEKLNKLDKRDAFMPSLLMLIKETLGVETTKVLFFFEGFLYSHSLNEQYSYNHIRYQESPLPPMEYNKTIRDDGTLSFAHGDNDATYLLFTCDSEGDVEEFDIYATLILGKIEEYHLNIRRFYSEISKASIEFLGNIPYPSLVLDKTQKILVKNESFIELFGNNIHFMDDFENWLVDERALQEIIATLEFEDSWRGILYFKKSNNEVFPQEVNIETTKDSKGDIKYYFLLFNELSVQSDVERKLDYYANYDFLTTLPNRKGFSEKVQYLLENKIEFALVLLDLDKFKFINDHYGHPFGDELLVVFSRILKKNLNKNLYKCRLSGDEFVVIYEGKISKEVIKGDIEGFITHFINPLKINNIEYKLSISAGITFAPDFGSSLGSIISSAEYAIEEAKEVDESSVAFYSHKMREKHLERLTIIQKLKNAIANREFYLNYQPIYNGEMRVEKVEALIRWRDSMGNNIAPYKFIPIAEESGLIGEISKLVGEMILIDLDKLHKLGLSDLKVAVNISLKDFEERYIKNQSILDLFMDNRHLAQNIVLEITESLFMKENINYLEQLTELKENGFHIALDDFGTGYSSLSYLTKLPIDTIKIDRSFILNLEDKKNFELVKIIINMAKVLGLKVVAEGVEELWHYETLKILECDFYQGYHLNKPMEFAKIVELLNKNC